MIGKGCGDCWGCGNGCGIDIVCVGAVVVGSSLKLTKVWVICENEN